MKRSISDDELRAAAKKELLEREKEELAGCEIIGKTEKEEITDGGIVYTAEYSLLEDIGAEQEIIFSDTDKDNS